MRLILFIAVLLSACASEPDDLAEPPAEPRAETVDADRPPVIRDTVRADWGRFFEDFGAVGTFALLDTETGQTSRYDPERAAARFTPASTFKVYNGLVFLDAGVVTDVDSVYAWDGVGRSISAWNRDHSLRSGTEFSVVWLFQHLANEAGREGYEAAFAKEPYGNATMGEPLDRAWLDGSLRISADEQVAFMDALRRGDLAFSAGDQTTIRDVLPLLDEGDGWRLRAKTGWGIPEGEPEIGWLVGWVERSSGDVVFAMNAEAAGDDSPWDMAPDRLRLVRAILESEDVISER